MPLLSTGSGTCMHIRKNSALAPSPCSEVWLECVHCIVWAEFSVPMCACYLCHSCDEAFAFLLCFRALHHLELPTAGHLFIMQGPLNWTREFCLLINKTRGGYLAQILNCPWVRGRNCHPPKLHRLLPLIAQRPVMARWNPDAESTYNLSPVTSGN